MNFLEKFLLFIHLIGMAYLVGGLLVQLKEKQKVINRGIRDGAYSQLVTGPVMLWIEATSESPEKFNDSVVGLKSLALIVILIIVFRSVRKKKISNKQYYAILISALTAVALAMFIY